MMSVFDKNYQIALFFRYDYLRADRQPEFTQIDIETSFMSSDDIMSMVKHMMKKLLKEVKHVDISLPFHRMPYDEAMSRFGSDKPDTRFQMELIHVSDIVEQSSFKVFKGAVEKGGSVCLLNVKGEANN